MSRTKTIAQTRLNLMSHTHTESERDRKRKQETWNNEHSCHHVWESGRRRKKNKHTHTNKPGKHTATVTRMASGTTGLDVSLVIRLNRVPFGALVTHPLLVVAVLPPEVLLDPHKVTEGMARVMVQATWLRTNKHLLLHPLCLPLEKLPRHLVPSPVHLEILVSLKPLVADLTHIPV